MRILLAYLMVIQKSFCDICCDNTYELCKQRECLDPTVDICFGR